MRFSQFIDVFVAALYLETELAGQTDFRMSEILGKYGLSLNPAWRESIFQDHSFSRYVDTRRSIGPAEQQHISISSDGIRWVEDELGENVSSFLEQNGVSVRSPDYADPAPIPISYNEVQEQEAFEVGTAIASADWTGIASRLTPEKTKEIAGLAGNLIESIRQSDLDDRTRDNAISRVEAAVRLLDSPDPPWEDVVGLLNNNVLQAFLTAMNILQLILWGAA